MQKFVTRLMVMPLMLLAASGCARTIKSVPIPSIECRKLVPPAWDRKVPDASAPDAGATILDTLKAWITFGAAQTVNKNTEFERATKTKEIIAQCESRWNKALTPSKK